MGIHFIIPFMPLYTNMYNQRIIVNLSDRSMIRYGSKVFLLHVAKKNYKQNMNVNYIKSNFSGKSSIYEFQVSFYN